MTVYAQLERATDDIRAPARGHDFFASCHERRTHNAGLFEAAAAAVALLEVADEGAVLERECEHRLKWKLERAREVFAQMVVDLVATVAEKFPRIKNVLRIECALNLAQDFEELVAELIAHVFGARDADTVLGGERTFELPHQRRGLISDLPEFFQIGRPMQIEHRPDMQQSAGSMAVVTRLQPERFHDRLQSAHVFGQLRRAHRSVFNECDRLCWPNAAGQKRETRFAHRPDQIHLRRVAQNFRAQPDLSRFQDRQPLCNLVVELDDQNRFARF